MELGPLIILGNALILGVRHGVDWDHVAAIADIVGSSSATSIQGGTVSIVNQANALRLSSCYALGHAAIVLVLGMAALMFAAVLPAWIDPLMEKAVGLTLIFLAAWIFYSMVRSSENAALQSRWMWLLSKVRHCGLCLSGKLAGQAVHQPQATVTPYDAPAAMGIGIIHGFGAETGTQVLLIATVGGSSNHLLGTLLLLSFITGLLISNTLVAVLVCAGYLTSARFKPILLTTSALTGVFSLVIGVLFLSGGADILPDWQQK